MFKKEYILLILSVFTFLYVLFAIVKGTLLYPISFEWYQMVWVFILGLPLVNSAQIIVNRDDINLHYWIAIVFNILTIAFIMKQYKIPLF